MEELPLVRNKWKTSKPALKLDANATTTTTPVFLPATPERFVFDLSPLDLHDFEEKRYRSRIKFFNVDLSTYRLYLNLGSVCWRLF